MSAYREDARTEVEAMTALRALNLNKVAGSIDATTDKYCICRHGRTPGMIQCDLCKDLFHSMSSDRFHFNSGEVQCDLCKDLFHIMSSDWFHFNSGKVQ